MQVMKLSKEIQLATMKLDLLTRSHAGQELIKVFTGSGVQLRVCSLQAFRVVGEY